MRYIKGCYLDGHGEPMGGQHMIDKCGMVLAYNDQVRGGSPWVGST